MALNSIGQMGTNPYEMYGKKPGMDNPFQTAQAKGEQSGVDFKGAGAAKGPSESGMYGKSENPFQGEQFADFKLPEQQGQGLSFMQNGDSRFDQQGAKLKSIAIA